MQVAGIICEYNPLHFGHKKQIQAISSLLGEDCGVVCLMSGNFVQRGHPAIIDKSLRAKAAVLCGADLVLELPLTASLSSAEGFAAKSVEILSPICSHLCFGAETDAPAGLMETAKVLLSDAFPAALSKHLCKGLSFPSARQLALEDLGFPGELLSSPNNILGIEYCKAILSQNSSLSPLPILRQGNYHDSVPDLENPSATAVRSLLLQGDTWRNYVPQQAQDCFAGAALHTLAAGEQAILYRLRTMADIEFEQLPYGSEGLWRKLMHCARRESSLQDILTAVKSKRYTRTRLDRMVMCATLGLTAEDLSAPVPYVRVLAFTDKGRQILRQSRNRITFRNAGEAVDDPYWSVEQRAGDLYGLFALNAPEKPGSEKKRRVYYQKP